MPGRTCTNCIVYHFNQKKAPVKWRKGLLVVHTLHLVTDGTVHVMDVPLTSGALAEMVKQQQQQQQQVAHEPEKDPIPTLPAETGKWL